MRWLAVLTVVLVLAAGPAWTAEWNKPGSSDWPPIPGNVGMKGFLGEWDPQCNDGLYIEEGRMTVHANGRISYAQKNPYLPTFYRVVEETAFYVLLMTRAAPRTIDGHRYDEDFHFVLLHPEGGFSDRDLSAFRLHKCSPDKKDVAGFSWDDDDQTARQIWRNSKSCNPTFRTLTELSPFFGEGSRFWSQPCNYWRPIQ
ncbi:hypothetical protein CU669_01550 [Paramagnetospirillum kuznetsovii]|uniref:Uncharacterized protein n=1 Tax=Paramagnetospirillum kuznetsovii TaxID=2053833 RepID=A0A364P3E3_9PROT|nr:hypothetical protein [Paramagnetospirillum kuznetsovii]RAU23800.1 hypothetical protein CU669_01550 [Paramagnetospirillum kuznetsovii]